MHKVSPEKKVKSENSGKHNFIIGESLVQMTRVYSGKSFMQQVQGWGAAFTRGEKYTGAPSNFTPEMQNKGPEK